VALRGLGIGFYPCAGLPSLRENSKGVVPYGTNITLACTQRWSAGL